jgi:hypothetical protein
MGTHLGSTRGNKILMTAEQIGEVFGKDLGGRMMALADQAPTYSNGESSVVVIQGDDLKIGGEGMLAFYDRNLVNITNNILKKLGGSKVEPMKVQDFNLSPHEEADVRDELVRRQRIADYGGLDRVVADREQLRKEWEAAGSPFPHRDSEAAAPFVERDAAIPPLPTESRQRYLNDLIARADVVNPGFVITPEMAAHAREGFALFQKNRGAYSPATDTISLLEHADLSTFLHESGHFFLEVYSRMADRTAHRSRSRRLRRLAQAGSGSRTRHRGRDEPRGEARRHEKFARGFEAYLFTGKAPRRACATCSARSARGSSRSTSTPATSASTRPPRSQRHGPDARERRGDRPGADAARSMEPLFADQAIRRA